jgi:hypothetical protein
MTMDGGQGSLTVLRDNLAAMNAPVLVRAAVGPGRHPVWYIDAIVAPPTPPSDWRPEIWEFAQVTFIAGQISSRSFAAALDYDAQILPLGGYDLTLPVLSEQTTWQRKPSRARYESVLLPWPAMIISLWELNNPQGHQQRPQDFLIGDDCPSFPSYEAAFRAFFYGEFTRSQGAQVPSGFATVRMVEGAAWLERIRVTPTSLDIRVGGSNPDGARVELNSATYRTDARVCEKGQAQLPLPDGLPDASWVYLSRDRRWLDYRAIGEYTAAELERAGVEIEVPEDPETTIQALLSQGEGQQVEFKRQLPVDSPESKRTIFKTVAAFANGHGGTIVFGIESDEATVCGLEDIDPLRERDRLTQLARSMVTPAPKVEVRQYELDGKTLLALTVESGANPPYGITMPGKKDKPIEFYVRRGATTFPARPEEIRNSVLATAPQSPSGSSWAYYS